MLPDGGSLTCRISAVSARLKGSADLTALLGRDRKLHHRLPDRRETPAAEYSAFLRSNGNEAATRPTTPLTPVTNTVLVMPAPNCLSAPERSRPQKYAIAEFGDGAERWDDKHKTERPEARHLTPDFREGGRNVNDRAARPPHIYPRERRPARQAGTERRLISLRYVNSVQRPGARAALVEADFARAYGAAAVVVNGWARNHQTRLAAVTA